MFDPPPGYRDLAADADTHPYTEAPSVKLDVDEVGVLLCRPPRPRAAAKLAEFTQRNKTPRDYLNALNAFVADHIGLDEHAWLVESLIYDELPEDAMGRVARKIATLGTERPYRAVMTLSGLAGMHWRNLRPRFMDKGIGDPMGLPSLHSLLDFTETCILESMQTGKPARDKMERERFINELYRPDPTEFVKTDDGRLVPAGFSDEETEASFDAFAAGLH